MKKKLQFLAILVIALVSNSVFAQTGTVSGTVQDTDTGELLPGANIFVVELERGAATNIDGEYTIIGIPSGTYTFRITYIGYAVYTEVIVVGSGTIQQDFNIKNDLLGLEELVVTGSGIATSKKKLGYDVSSVGSEELNTTPVNSLDAALSGKIAGANITTSGAPGQGAIIQLRGVNSLGSTTPMILVDGIQISTGLSDNGGGFDVSSRLSDIDFGDIERVEVIKGAAAGTIYGAQGANGVIQIFTKKGTAGKTEIDFSSSYGVDQRLGTVSKANRHHLAVDADGSISGLTFNAVTGQWNVPNASIDANTTVSNPYTEQIFSSLNPLFRDGITRNNRLRISGGNTTTTYLVSVSSNDQDGVVKNTSNYRNNILGTITTEIFENASMTLRLNGIQGENRGQDTGNNVNAPLSYSLFNLPFINIAQRDEQGNYVATQQEGDNASNPLWLWSVDDQEAEIIRGIAGINLTYTPTNFLEFNYTGGIDHYNNQFDQIRQNHASNTIATLTPAEGFVNRVVDRETNVTSTINGFLKLDLARDFNFATSILTTTHVAFDYRSNRYQQTSTFGQGLPPFQGNNTLRNTTTPTVDEFISELNTFGWLINQKVDIDEFGGFEGGIRFDKSSAFGKGSEFSYFPRGAAYLRLSSFDFWDGLRDTFSEVKLRVSYGEAGIQPGAFSRIVTFQSLSIGSGNGIIPRTTAPNPELLVQQSKELEFGYDLNIKSNGNWFSNISNNTTYWTRESGDVIRQLEVAPSTGIQRFNDNSIVLDSRGFDISLSSLVYYDRNTSWTSTFNFGTAVTEVASIANNEDVIIELSSNRTYFLREGERFATHFGFKTIKSFDETDSEGEFLLDQTAVANGDYVIVNGNVVEQATRAVQFRSEQEKIGDPAPDFTLGFRNEVVHKDFTLAIQFDWVYGSDIYNGTKQWLYRDLIHEDVTQEVSIGDETGAFAQYYQSIYNTNDKNELFIEDGSYVRLRELAVSYDFASLLGISQIKKARLSLSGRNLLTFDDYSGFDPEVNQYFGSTLGVGTDEFTYPNFRSYNVSINFGF